MRCLCVVSNCPPVPACLWRCPCSLSVRDLLASHDCKFSRAMENKRSDKRGYREREREWDERTASPQVTTLMLCILLCRHKLTRHQHISHRAARTYWRRVDVHVTAELCTVPLMEDPFIAPPPPCYVTAKDHIMLWIFLLVSPFCKVPYCHKCVCYFELSRHSIHVFILPPPFPWSSSLFLFWFSSSEIHPSVWAPCSLHPLHRNDCNSGCGLVLVVGAGVPESKVWEELISICCISCTCETLHPNDIKNLISKKTVVIKARPVTASDFLSGRLFL